MVEEMVGRIGIEPTEYPLKADYPAIGCPTHDVLEESKGIEPSTVISGSRLANGVLVHSDTLQTLVSLPTTLVNSIPWIRRKTMLDAQIVFQNAPPKTFATSGHTTQHKPTVYMYDCRWCVKSTRWPESSRCCHRSSGASLGMCAPHLSLTKRAHRCLCLTGKIFGGHAGNRTLI